MADKYEDDISGSPVVSPNVSDVSTFVPTGSWITNTVYTGQIEQRGVKAHVEIKIALGGAPTSANLTVNLPFTIDTTKMISVDTSSANILEGSNVTIRDAGTGSYVGAVGYASSTTVAIYFLDDAAAALSVINPVSQAAPMTFASGDFIIIRFIVPVVGYNASSVYGAGGATGSRLGLVQQSVQTAITVTCPQAGFSVVRAIAVAYVDTNGAWRMRFNINADYTSATVTTLTLSISGTTFKNAGAVQACTTFYKGNISIIPRGFANSATSTISIDSASATLTTGLFLSGDVELDSKPSWA